MNEAMRVFSRIDKCISGDTIEETEVNVMTKAALKEENDALGILALGSLIVNLGQGMAHGNLASQHRQLLARYRELVARYNQMWREFEGLRSVNEQLQRQGREYQRIVDDLRGELSKAQVRLAQKEAAK